ncbi:MAG: AAA family ATPase [Desulfuromonas sp.]|nr:MAG: AAA family ATPase [Desulfuromonas sp.]
MQEKLTYNVFCQQVAAKTPLIFITTDNESRTEALITRAALQGIKGMPGPMEWNCTTGFPGIDGTVDPQQALRYVLEHEGHGIFLFKDMTWFWEDNPFLQRMLKDFAAIKRQATKVMVFVAAEISIPATLREDFLILHHALPDREEIHAHLQTKRQKDTFLKDLLDDDDKLAALTVAGQGLDIADIDRALRLARVAKDMTLERVNNNLLQVKQQILNKSGIMEFVDNDVKSNQVGGLQALKAWMAKRESAFGLKELNSGRNLPKGVLMMGISGCGKSLFVKAIADRWRLPLIRLDMATVYSGAYGSPESSLRKACQTAEALSPCVLWIDEIEAGISSQGFKAEGGAASRVLGYFLTWMQEKRHPVFVAATANAIELLPAEVLRKGRFDEIFYVTLPGVVEREDIFRIHLKKRSFDPEKFNVSILSHSSKGFSGAEIEQAVASASFEAMADKREMEQKDLTEAISSTVPLSVTMAEQIKKIEAWAFKRAVPASGVETAKSPVAPEPEEGVSQV